MTIQTQVRPSSVFVVSGGAKGITAECAIKMAQHQPCKFILLGRSELLEVEPEFAQDCFEEAALKKRIMDNLLAQGEKPTPMSVLKTYNKIVSSREIKKTITRIRQTGAEAEYISVDVTDIAALQQKLAGVGAITGIIHGAGNLADKLIEKKTDHDFEKVYTAKVQGLENLLACVNLQQLEHLVLFSSVTGFYGNIGQSDYAIANEILNKSAHLIKQNYPQCHVVAINWGAWDSGMVSPELKKAFADRGIDVIPVDVGTQMLVNELHPAHSDTAQVVIGSPLVPQARELDSQLRTHCIRRHMKLEINPFLYDHVIAGSPVLPATCAMSWIINSCEEIYPGYQLVNYTDFKVLKGITFNDTLAKEHILEIEEVEKVNPQRIKVKAKILSQNSAGKIHYHFSAQLNLHREIPPAPTYEFINLNPDYIITTTGKDFYQNGGSTLFHGSSFQEVQRVLNITSDKITTECLWTEISAKKQGQFPFRWVNPYTTDLSMHALWIWTQHFYQEGCLPGKVEKFEQFSPTPHNEPFYVSCEIKNKTSSSAMADFIIHDNQGKVYSRMLGAHAIIWSMKQLKS
ncbi:SDR family NAD(P)-dependent oxidoreductase [Umezakia ovalisporum]|jgi:acyl transferase domain-containing protein|uniref:SDR family NAD(P)-dependent oxidoreductase n=1 Tax=Umezakia ovalisporum TaxID=75695 RepID=UPI0006F1280A|nr:SDR family NAD(P)-dependent oxidoreductase [Umezakia ovalisporum]MBI1242422.1 SDR family NAD(P)-dependent oxidoreductase [Nostoc sp. RI_552]MDH6083543.1 SDR family NAD(P)-dependent oxidoreductase [Umezakia ovalisporum TAC611]MDH6087209.1 SDR family NAD(P)-dependent oxidoreductase [Umezakia ovalisporum Ak1311]CEJ45525.1 KR [Umezakia ovalisporum]